jgi:pimeloyl-ACP methyl ester carboxylesterase
VLKDFKKAILFIIGEKDSAVPLEHSMQQSFLPELCYIHILENTGHMGMFERKNRSNEILNEFLKEVKE